MTKIFFSLQFRLALGFTFVLVLALAGVSFYVGYAAEKEVGRFEASQEQARIARVEQVMARFYRDQRDIAQLQSVVEQTGRVLGRRIVVRGRNGEILVDSHARVNPRRERPAGEPTLFPVVVSGQQVSSFSITLDIAPEDISDPAVASLVSTVNQSLLWTGIAAVVLGTLLVSIISRRLLAPVTNLSEIAQHLGEGDFTRRAPPEGSGELRQLAVAFNSMATNLEDVERQRRNLVADVAHELRTPVSNIQGYLEALKDGLLQPDDGTIDTIHGQVIHLGHLVEDLRLLAQAEAGALNLHLIPGQMPDVLRVCVDALRPRAGAKGINVTLDADESMLLVDMDGTRISQVVNNLLENAIIHTPEGGTVSVRVGANSDGMIRVAVADTGIGIPSDDLDRVFDRFFRSDPSRNRATGGVGLGLTIAKRLVEAHGGSIHVENVVPNGARFVFEIPVSAVSE